MYFVYLITNRINGKVYVGKAKVVSRRWAHHKYQARSGHKTLLHKAIRKYGTKNFLVTTVASCATEDDAYECERIVIAQTKSNDRVVGYNRTNGGRGLDGYRAAEETRQKQRALKRGTQVSPETRSLMSLRMRLTKPSKGFLGSVNSSMMLSGWGLSPWGERFEKRDVDGFPLESATRLGFRRFHKTILMSASKLGSKQSAETIAKRVVALRGPRGPSPKGSESAKRRVAEQPDLVSALTRASVAARKGKPLSDRHRAKIAARSKSRGAHTEEERRAISEALRGHTVSPETRAKISAALKARARASKCLTDV